MNTTVNELYDFGTVLRRKLYHLSQTTNLSADALHRIASVASGASILPHNGALLTLLAVTGLRHKETYKDVFVVAFIIPTIALFAGVALAAASII